jgi:uncharacterized protein
MNYLITVAIGLIGHKLLDLLLSHGNTVNYLGRKRSGTLDSRASFHCWSPEEPPPLNSVPRLDVIIPLAGEHIAQRWNREVKQRIYDSRVASTRKLVAGMAELKYKPSVLISASAVGYYGDRGEEVLTEASGPGTDFLAELCVEWEHEAFRAREFGVRVVPVRIATVLGRNGGALKQMLVPFRLGLGGKFGSGRQWMSWIHIDDLANLFIFVAENARVTGPLNGSSPRPVTNAQFTGALARVLHRPAILPMPRVALKLVLGELADFLFSSLRVIPEAALQAGFPFDHPDLEAALRVLF